MPDLSATLGLLVQMRVHGLDATFPLDEPEELALLGLNTSTDTLNRLALRPDVRRRLRPVRHL